MKALGGSSPLARIVEPGDTVVLRYFHLGRLAGAIPTRLIGPEGPVLWLPARTPLFWPSIDGRPVRELDPSERYSDVWTPGEGAWIDRDVLVVGRAGRAHSVWLFWTGSEFEGWYVNLETPWRRSPVGFDSEDHELDLWIEPDGAWEWRDEDELELAVVAGVLTREQAEAIRAEGERVVEEWPFPTGWEGWRPEPGWERPTLPAEWSVG